MFKLENYSLKKRMQLVAVMGIVGLFLLVAMFWYLGLTNHQVIVGLGVVSIASVIFFLIATHMGDFGAQRANTLVAGIQNIKKGDLTQEVAIAGKSDFSWMAFELNSARKNVSELVKTLVSGVAQMQTETQTMSATSRQTVEGVLAQQAETTRVANSMSVMTASVQDVAKTASDTAEAARNADSEAQAGKQVVTEAMHAIDSLASEVEKAADTLNNLEADIGNIGAIVDVIRGITEQTNLLALNAAIEAARAGEHGRGFAVVADEVRTLAARTQDSTHEIEEMVGRLQAGASAAVSVMNEGREQAQKSVEKAASASAALDTITAMISTMDEMSASISSAANEQSSAAEDINRGIANISQVADGTAVGGQDILVAIDSLSALSSQLQDAANKFKV